MIKTLIALFLLGAISAQPAEGQSRSWNGKKAAVALTYDDAYNQQLDNAIPVLDSLGLKATFYITAFSSSGQTRLGDWKRVAQQGHELGNHTLFHPCTGDQPGRSFVPPDYKLNNYTVKRMIDEVRMTNVFLQSLDGKTERSFAFTCGDTKIGDTSFIDSLQQDFVAARVVRNEMHTIKQVQLYSMDGYMVNNHSAAEMIGWVNEAIRTNSLLVILFHGVGGGNGLDVSIQAHRELLHYINSRHADLWVAPVTDIASFIKLKQPQNGL